jgi:hypothetical protein
VVQAIQWAPARSTFMPTARTRCIASMAQTSLDGSDMRFRRAVRLTNEDVIDLYSRVKTGAAVVVLGPKQGPNRIASASAL